MQSKKSLMCIRWAAIGCALLWTGMTYAATPTSKPTKVIHYHYHYHIPPHGKRPKLPKATAGAQIHIHHHFHHPKPHQHPHPRHHHHHKHHRTHKDHGHHHHKHHGHHSSKHSKGHKHHAHGHHKGHHHGHKHHGHKGHKHAMRHHGMQHDFSDVKRWVRIFENPRRKSYQKPAEVAKAMQIKPGMVVADIGAGTGYFLPHLRAVLGKTGRLLALDIAKPLVKYMNERVQKAGWKNVLARVVRSDDPMLKPGSVDRILIANTWHHMGNRKAYGQKLKASLKPGGAVYIVDFTMDSPFGPGKHHRLTPQQVVKELQSAGFRASVVKESLPHHYIVVGR